jgi:undecaprenyl-diphosphatase
LSIFEAIILGIIEGITEFLPISSTGHLIVASEFLKLEQTAVNKAFEVIIQFGAILAVVLSYPSKFSPKHFELWVKITLAFIPIGAVGFLFADEIKALFSIEIVAYMFIVGGIIFLIVEKFYEPKAHHISDIETISYKQAMLVGLAQITALIPGTSRAGATIIGGLLVGLTRKASAEFSFLLAMPVMLAVTLYDIVKHYEDFTSSNLIVLAVGFVVSFFVAFIVIKLFIKFLEKFTFVAFGIYRIVLGLILLMFFV